MSDQNDLASKLYPSMAQPKASADKPDMTAADKFYPTMRKPEAEERPKALAAKPQDDEEDYLPAVDEQSEAEADDEEDQDEEDDDSKDHIPELDTDHPLYAELEELDLSDEQIEKLADLRNRDAEMQWANIAEDWRSDAMASPTFDRDIADAKAALRTYGSEEVTELLNRFALGNNRHVIEFLAKVNRRQS